MIFHKTLRQELGRNFGVTLLVLLTIVLTILLIRTLAFVSSGRVGPGDTSLFLVYSILAYLPMLATVALFIAMVAALSRLYRDSEMAVWMSSGIGLWTFRRPLLSFALPAVLGILVVTLVLWPWSNVRIQELREQFAQRSIFDRIEPGRFQETADGLRVVYIDNNASMAKDDAKNQTSVPGTARNTQVPTMAQNVFIATFEPQSISYTAAPLAFSENEQGRLLIALQNGRQLRLNAAQPPQQAATIDIIGFSQLEVSMQLGQRAKALSTVEDKPKALDSWSLWQRWRAAPNRAEAAPMAAEIFWRLSFALAAFNAVFLAMAIVIHNPRMRWSPHLLVAFCAFFAYYSGISAMENRILAEKTDLLRATVYLHAGVLLLSLLVIALRQNPQIRRWLWPFTWLRLLTRHSRGAAA